MAAGESERFGVVGCGLIGASLIAAIGEALGPRPIRVHDTSAANLLEAKRRFPDIADSAIEEFADCGYVFVCTPVSYVAGHVRNLSAIVDADACTIIDTGSTKAAIVADFASNPVPNFVPGHPLAGGYASGPAEGTASIISGRNFVLTPTAGTSARHVARAADLLDRLGARVVTAEPALHDRVLAITSHVPHMLAFAMVELLMEAETGQDRRQDPLIGRSFRQMTAFARGDPEMWADIAISNRRETAGQIERMKAILDEMGAAAARGDKPALIERLQRIQHRRNAIEDDINE